MISGWDGRKTRFRLVLSREEGRWREVGILFENDSSEFKGGSRKLVEDDDGFMNFFFFFFQSTWTATKREIDERSIIVIFESAYSTYSTRRL